MSKYDKIKKMAMRTQDASLSLESIEQILLEEIAKSKLEAPFQIQKERHFIFVICPLPLKHNFMIRSNLPKPFLFKYLNEFPDNTFSEDTMFSLKETDLRSHFRVYLENIRDLINNYL